MLAQEKIRGQKCCRFQIDPTTWVMYISYIGCIFMLSKCVCIVSQRQINTTTIYIYFFMCDRLTKIKSQVKNCRFQIHPTTLVMSIFYIRCIFMLVSAHTSSHNVAYILLHFLHGQIWRNQIDLWHDPWLKMSKICRSSLNIDINSISWKISISWISTWISARFCTRTSISWNFFHIKFHYVGLLIFNLYFGSFLQVFSWCIFIIHTFTSILQYLRIVLNVCTILHFIFLCIRLLLSYLGQRGIEFWD